MSQDASVVAGGRPPRRHVFQRNFAAVPNVYHPNTTNLLVAAPPKHFLIFHTALGCVIFSKNRLTDLDGLTDLDRLAALENTTPSKHHSRERVGDLSSISFLLSAYIDQINLPEKILRSTLYIYLSIIQSLKQ